MNITDLVLDDKICLPIAFDVIVDGECFTPPKGLEIIGLRWQGTGPREISDLLIDTIIAYGLSGVEVVVEVAPHDEVDHDYLLMLAGNAGFSVSSIPPQTEEDLEAWSKQCVGFTTAFLTTPNFSKTLFPISGFFSYLIAEFFAGADSLYPTDEYTILRFVEPTPTQ
ncbi:hypothetical protein ACOI1H_18940, partial [Loktanella sp. DJP18]|uniref:hypothetical protein n=1 Tax=Loktanella sp. DJP18 TaxID=3409788 RepID=UPI003BB767EA